MNVLPWPRVELTEAQKASINRIRELKREKRAIILSHNYQRPEIYEVADFIGDSLELCRKARDTDARMILFSGVFFMAESAAVLNPGMKVIVPTLDAGCALSDMITPSALMRKKQEFPDATVVCYVNSTAAVKALSDVFCTSSNAVAVIRALPHRRVLFVPDKNLAS
ncbi:quinolinate synthase NadA, partial [Candidatus Peregrinibacteria bacterium]|nr:quinolinate synthase NadA [Candidatus Peregrinibacteria bacterium]